MRSRSPVTYLQGNTEILRRIKAVVLDLDGTLLHSDRTISERTHLALDGVRELGIEIIIATARPPRAVAGMLPLSYLDNSFIVYYNGALIVNNMADYIEHRSLHPDLVRYILDEVEHQLDDTCLTFESQDRWLCLPGLPEGDRAELRARYGDEPATIEPRELLALPISKILWHNRSDDLRIVSKFADRSTVLVTDGGALVQVSAGEATKEAAVERVFDMLALNATDAAVFGDDTNDLGLFGLCGFPVAMGNAIPELKAVAQLVTLGNDQDGVAIVLEEIINAREYS